MRGIALALVCLVGCADSSAGTGGAGGTGGAISTTSATVASSTSSSSSSTAIASSTSTGTCTPATSCPTDACGDFPDGCGSTIPCATVCGIGTECSASNACAPCADAATCESCFPSGAQQQAACSAAGGPHVGCGPAQASIGVACVGSTFTSFPVDCNYDPGQEACLVKPDHYCRDVALNQPCVGSKNPPTGA